VEMAISMLILVPVFLYALFLGDLLRYSLDVQETALSTVWDFTVQDYTVPQIPVDMKSPGGGNTRVQYHARHMFCDHESGIDSFQTRSYPDEDGKTRQNYPDCEETGHHKALAAHVCWINPDAKQVTCEKGEKMAASLGERISDSFQSSFTHGGLIRCEARAVVENYLLPKQFLAQFAKKDLTKKKWRGQGQEIHDNSELGTADNAYFIKKQQLAILADTWALTPAESIRPGPPSPPTPGGAEASKRPQRNLRATVELVYRQPEEFDPLSKATNSFFESASKVLRPKLRELADDPVQPNLSIVPVAERDPVEEIQQENSKSSYFNTEWKDWDRNHTVQTYKRRKAGYLGCSPEMGC
jgi:hypothetical protein